MWVTVYIYIYAWIKNFALWSNFDHYCKKILQSLCSKLWYSWTKHTVLGQQQTKAIITHTVITRITHHRLYKYIRYIIVFVYKYPQYIRRRPLPVYLYPVNYYTKVTISFLRYCMHTDVAGRVCQRMHEARGQMDTNILPVWGASYPMSGFLFTLQKFTSHIL